MTDATYGLPPGWTWIESGDEVRATNERAGERTRWKRGKGDKSARGWALDDIKAGRLQRLAGGQWHDNIRD